MNNLEDQSSDHPQEQQNEQPREPPRFSLPKGAGPGEENLGSESFSRGGFGGN